MSNIEQSTVSRFGRRFHEYSLRENANILPVDQTEEDRLGDWDLLLRVRLDGVIFIPGSRSLNILDCGSGPGTWGDHVEEQHDGAQVYGIDVYTDNFDDDDNDESGDEAMSLAEEPLECEVVSSESQYQWAQDLDDEMTSDQNEELPRRITWDLNTTLQHSPLCRASKDGFGLRQPVQLFDLVNMRCLAQGVLSSRWRPLLSELGSLLFPGGWIQIVECDFSNIQSRSGRLGPSTLTTATGLQDWIQEYRGGMRALGRDYTIGERVASELHSVGFIQIQRVTHRFHIGAWQKSSDDVELRNQMRELVIRSLEPLSVWILCGVRQMSKGDFDNLISRAAADLRDPATEAYLEWNVVIGQRPPGNYRPAVSGAVQSSAKVKDHDGQDNFMKPLSPAQITGPARRAF
ncbi:Hypothetical protein D9617_8g049130 [Elsinoe fawcettii]|nr:Hypothetical protein D9617_8g049130 [Elsinoe fawcettii]